MRANFVGPYLLHITMAALNSNNNAIIEEVLPKCVNLFNLNY